jgi:hypothetical protein
MEKILTGISRVKDKLSPLERAWEFRNYIGASTGRYDKADEIGAMFCDLIKMYVANDKMLNRTDDDCTEYWQKTKEYLLGGR